MPKKPKNVSKPADSQPPSSTSQQESPKAMASGIPVWCDHTVLVDVTDMRPNPRNPNQHPDKQIALLAKNIRHLGWRHPITVSLRSKCIVAGHGRLQAAQLLKVEKVPVDFQWFATDADEYAVLLADNKIAELAETDKNILKELMSDLDGIMGLKDHELTGYSKEEWENLLASGRPHAPELLDEAPEVAKVAITKPGDLYILKGKNTHRLLCGDSREHAHVAALMDGRTASMVFTDPPYGVEYVGKTKEAMTIKNDGAKELGTLINASLGLALKFTADGGAWYVCAPAGPQFYDFATFLLGAKIWRQTLVWMKDVMVMGRSDYHYRHEAIFYGWKPGAAHQEMPDRTQTTVWEIKRPKRSELHPTTKPVELIARAVNNSSRGGDLVLDLFGGSGTTAIGSEFVGRDSCLMEIDPLYADVIVKRFLGAYPGSSATLRDKEIVLADFPVAKSST